MLITINEISKATSKVHCFTNPKHIEVVGYGTDEPNKHSIPFRLTIDGNVVIQAQYEDILTDKEDIARSILFHIKEKKDTHITIDKTDSKHITITIF